VVLVLLKYTLFVTQKMQERIRIILDIEWILDIKRILELVSTIEYRFHGQRPDVHIYCHYALKVSPFFHTYLSLLSINDYQSSMKYFTEDGHFHLNICLRGLHAGRASHIFFQYDTKWLRVRQSESF